MNKKLESRIDQVTRKFEERCGSLSSEQLNWKPAPDRWSIAQNIEHLLVLNGSYFPYFSSMKEGTLKSPFIARIGFLVSLFGNMLLKGVQPDRKRKVKTFSVWKPSESEISEGILSKFKEQQEELKSWIQKLEEQVEKGAIIPSPANGKVVYKLGTAFEIIVAHEERHLEQAREVLTEMEQQAEDSSE